uniref:Uncharacterized protein n=1 Tax=Panagrolaimus davidi TaxID=227884 RepID=A0A914QRZ8_9BILA
MGELSLSPTDLIGAGADKDKNDTMTFITIAAASDYLLYTITWKPLDATTTTPSTTTTFPAPTNTTDGFSYTITSKPLDPTTTTTPTPTTITKSSSIMASPKFFNSLLLIALYNFFTFSK